MTTITLTPENVSYGPMTAEEFSSTMKSWMEIPDITEINATSESFDFLKEEPEMYSQKDLEFRPLKNSEMTPKLRRRQKEVLRTEMTEFIRI